MSDWTEPSGHFFCLLVRYYECINNALPSELSDHLYDVIEELVPVTANWEAVGIALRLKSHSLATIQAKYRDDLHKCLTSMVMEWLKRNYDVNKFGKPTWQKLVEAVNSPAGGANTALAIDIARRHKAGGMSSGCCQLSDGDEPE